MSGRPPFSIVQKVLIRLQRYRIASRSSETAFYLLLALFPFLIFAVSLFGLLSQSLPFRQDILTSLAGVVPAPVFDFLSDILDELVASRNITFMSFSMLGFIWAASQGFSIILQGLNMIYSARKPLHPVILRLLGLLFAILLVLAILVTMAFVTFGDLLFRQIAASSGQDIFRGSFLLFLRYLFSFLFLLLIFSLLYYLACRRKGGFLRAMPGGAFTSCCWLLFSYAFSWYVNNFGRYAKLYGSLAGFIILMFWLYFCSMMILAGGILHQLLLERQRAKRIAAFHNA